MDYTFDNPGPVSADLRIAGGQINVDTTETETITVSVEPMDGSTQSREAAEQTRVSLDGKQLIVHQPDHKGWALFRWPKLSITVRLPQDSALTIKAASADIRCNGIYREVVVQSASGDVWVDRVTSNLSNRSASGDLNVGWVGGSVQAHTASGNIKIQHVGRDADVNSASGDIEVGQLQGSIRGKTASGDVRIGCASQGEVKVNSVSGDVDLGILAGTGVWLEVSSVSGRTTSELSMGGDSVPPTGASLKVRVRTVSGDIELRRVVTTASQA